MFDSFRTPGGFDGRVVNDQLAPPAGWRHVDGSPCTATGPQHRGVAGPHVCYGHDRRILWQEVPAGACATQQRGRKSPTVTQRLQALEKLADDFQTEANRLDDERGDEYDVYSEAMADTLASAAAAIRSVLHPRVDLTSSAARQHYIDSGVYPTLTETQEV